MTPVTLTNGHRTRVREWPLVLLSTPRNARCPRTSTNKAARISKLSASPSRPSVSGEDGRSSTRSKMPGDRLSRSMPDFSTIMATAQRQGWALVALDAPVDTTSPAGEAMANALAHRAVRAGSDRRRRPRRPRCHQRVAASPLETPATSDFSRALGGRSCTRRSYTTIFLLRAPDSLGDMGAAWRRKASAGL
jgi:hypothetical protein